MRVVVVAPPVPVVSFAEAAARLKLGSIITQQADVESMIAGATAMFDGPGGGWLGRAIGSQTLELRCDGFIDCHGNALRLPFPPITSITSVKYLDQAGVERTLSSESYELVDRDLLPSLSGSFPSTIARPEAVRVRYVAGYSTVPANIRNGILLAVGDMYRFRETLALTTVEQLPSAASIESLLGTLRVYR